MYLVDFHHPTHASSLRSTTAGANTDEDSNHPANARAVPVHHGLHSRGWHSVAKPGSTPMLAPGNPTGSHIAAVPVAEVGCLEVGFSQYGYSRLPAWRPSGILLIGTGIRAAGTQSCSTNVKCPVEPSTWTIPNDNCSRLCKALGPMQIPGIKRVFLYHLRRSAVISALRP